MLTTSSAAYESSTLPAGTTVKVVEKTDAESKIEAAAFSYSETIDYKAYTESYLPIAKFTLSDVGPDGKATVLNGITVELGNWQNVSSVAIYDGSEMLQEAPVSGATSAFSELDINAASGATKDFNIALPERSAKRFSQPTSIRSNFAGESAMLANHGPTR